MKNFIVFLLILLVVASCNTEATTFTWKYTRPGSAGYVGVIDTIYEPSPVWFERDSLFYPYGHNTAGSATFFGLDSSSTVGFHSIADYASAQSVSSDCINVQKLSGALTLTNDSCKYQHLDPNGANRTITLPTSGVDAGKVFVIRNTAALNTSYHLTTGSSYEIDADTELAMIFNGSDWLPEYKSNISIGNSAYNNYGLGIGIGMSATNNHTYGIGIGYQTYNNYSYGVGIGSFVNDNYSYGVGIGFQTDNNRNYGVGIGFEAKNNYTNGIGIGYAADNNYSFGIGIGSRADDNYNYGTGIGSRADDNYNYGTGIGSNSTNNYNYGTGIGYYATCGGNQYAVALGAKRIATRRGEVSMLTDELATSKNNYYIAHFVGESDDDSGDIIFLNAADYCTIPANSAVMFKIYGICKDASETNMAIWTEWTAGCTGIAYRVGTASPTVSPTTANIAPFHSVGFTSTPYLSVSAGSSNDLQLTVTGQAGTNLDWNVVIELIEITE